MVDQGMPACIQVFLTTYLSIHTAVLSISFVGESWVSGAEALEYSNPALHGNDAFSFASSLQNLKVQREEELAVWAYCVCLDMYRLILKSPLPVSFEANPIPAPDP